MVSKNTWLYVPDGGAIEVRLNGNWIAEISTANSKPSITFNTGSSEKVSIYCRTNGNGSTSKTTTFTNIQLEQGTIATEYEKYVGKKIYCINNNGFYEEFLNVDLLMQ